MYNLNLPKSINDEPGLIPRKVTPENLNPQLTIYLIG